MCRSHVVVGRGRGGVVRSGHWTSKIGGAEVDDEEVNVVDVADDELDEELDANERRSMSLCSRLYR